MALDKKQTTLEFSPPPLDTVYVFVDHSNFFHQAKEAVPKLLGLEIAKISHLMFDYGALLTTIVGERELGDKCVVVASTPSPHEAQLKQLDNTKFRTIIFERHRYTNKEKGVDVALTVEAMEVILKNQPPSTIALVTGDGDYLPLVKKALAYGWTIELHFWPTGEYDVNLRCLQCALSSNSTRFSGIAEGLLPHINNVRTYEHFKKYTYAYSGEPDGMFSFDITHDDIREFHSTDILKLGREIHDGFIWWMMSQPNTLKFIFLDKSSMENAVLMLSRIKPGWEIYRFVPSGRKGKRYRDEASESSFSNKTSRSRSTRSRG